MGRTSIHTIPTRTVRCFLNNKPWITSDVKALLNNKKRAFLSGNRGSYISVTTVQGRNHLSKMVKKQAGPDIISSQLLRNCFDQHCDIVQHVFNLSLRLGRVPELYKTSCLVPVPKTPPPIGAQRLQASNTDISPGEDPGGCRTNSRSTPGKPRSWLWISVGNNILYLHQ